MSTRPTTDGTRREPPIGPDDPRYQAVVEKRFNKRFTARPDYVRLVDSTEMVAAAVEDAVREGRRLVVTSGGHCLEGSWFCVRCAVARRQVTRLPFITTAAATSF